MNIFNSLLINCVVLLFPIVLNLIYSIYNKNLNKEQSNMFLDFSLLSSFYLFTIINKTNDYNHFIILLNIPLVISYIKKRGLTSIIISFGIIYTYHVINGYNVFILTFEYIIYYLFYFLVLRKRKSDLLFFRLFIIFKILFQLEYFIIQKEIYLISFINNLLILLLFILVLYVIVYMFKKFEDIIKLHMTIKQLKKDKQIRNSLFKITHEIKNPIAVCKSYLDMFDFNNKDHERYIPIVREEIERILILLQDFLSMNKIKINKEILDINYLLEDLIKQYKPILNENGIELFTNISDDEIFIEGDYNRLNQVLINIIKNSMEAFDKEKSYIKLNYEIEKNNYKITIEDNGAGINEEDLEKIKEPFYTTKKNGTGLGVSLSIEIIEAHGGNINYYSKVGEGTKVVITLPLSSLISF